MSVNTKGLVICVVSPNKGMYLQTFIHAHIKQLPLVSNGIVETVYGDSLPRYRETDS